MRTLAFIICFIGTLVSWTTHADAKGNFNPTAEPQVVGSVCFSSKGAVKNYKPGQTYRWTRYMVEHMGKKCWHVLGDTHPVPNFRPMTTTEQIELFQEFMDWHNSRHGLK